MDSLSAYLNFCSAITVEDERAIFKQMDMERKRAMKKSRNWNRWQVVETLKNIEGIVITANIAGQPNQTMLFEQRRQKCPAVNVQ